jgi:hypothetical protein
MFYMKLGADPEVFPVRNGKVVPVCGYIPGTKEKPMAVTKGAIQEDNVAAEFNIEPASTKDEWIANITQVMHELTKYMGKYGMGVMIKGSHVFDPLTLSAAGDKAFRFGCSPDFNAWTHRMQKVNTSKNPNLRTCGGHVHVEGGTDNTVRWMDLLLGVPSLLLDDDKDRRKLYGAPGSFRYKPYGVEYRAISNFWLRSTELMGWVWDASELALQRTPMVMNDRRVYAAMAGDKKGLAKELIKEYMVHAPGI